MVTRSPLAKFQTVSSLPRVRMSPRWTKGRGRLYVVGLKIPSPRLHTKWPYVNNPPPRTRSAIAYPTRGNERCNTRAAARLLTTLQARLPWLVERRTGSAERGIQARAKPSQTARAHKGVIGCAEKKAPLKFGRVAAVDAYTTVELSQAGRKFTAWRRQNPITVPSPLAPRRTASSSARR